jgi:hypothetical protein
MNTNYDIFLLNKAQLDANCVLTVVCGEARIARSGETHIAKLRCVRLFFLDTGTLVKAGHVIDAVDSVHRFAFGKHAVRCGRACIAEHDELAQILRHVRFKMVYVCLG